MMNQNQIKALTRLKNEPVKVGQKLGFDKLEGIHNKWILSMLYGKGDCTLQSHRGSYKTTCVAISLLLIIILFPNEKTVFIRKTDSDAKEIIEQVYKMLKSEFINELVRIIWGVDLIITRHNATEINTNLTNDPRGMNQLTGMGIGGSITGKHFDRIFTDDIVNLSDRISRAEREHTKMFYQELENIKNPTGRIFNTGTPWHVEDCFVLMPNLVRYDCYQTGLLSDEQIEELRNKMMPSLFSANYELKHIASENVLFNRPKILDASIETVKNGIAHLDSAFYGEDYTAFSIMAYHGEKYYLFGKVWRKHVEDCYNDIIDLYHAFQCGKLYNELNADKGLVARDLRSKGLKVVTYTESMNKHIKIATYLKRIWDVVCIVEGTDEKYIKMILDYTEDAEHDDAPDSASCLARIMYKHSSDKADRGSTPYLL